MTGQQSTGQQSGEGAVQTIGRLADELSAAKERIEKLNESNSHLQSELYVTQNKLRAEEARSGKLEVWVDRLIMKEK